MQFVKRQALLMLKELKFSETVKIKLLVDNKSVIELVNHLMSHGTSKHIERKWYYFRGQVSKNRLEIEYCKTKLQPTNIPTNPLKRAWLRDLKKLMKMTRLLTWIRKSIVVIQFSGNLIGVAREWLATQANCHYVRIFKVNLLSNYKYSLRFLWLLDQFNKLSIHSNSLISYILPSSLCTLSCVTSYLNKN